MKRNHTETAESPEQLVTSLRSLLAEAEELVSHSGVEFAGEKANDIQARFAHLQEQLQEYYGRARDKVVAGAKQADRTIRAHPYESLAVALGVGVLLGALLRRQG